MKTTHELTLYARCPVNGAVDCYAVFIETRHLLKVESILAAVRKLPKKAFQEIITMELATALRCKVTTVGHHSGVKTTCCA